VRVIDSIRYGAALLVLGASVAFLPASARIDARGDTSWAQARMVALADTLGTPLPTTLHDLIEFAQLPDAADRQHYCLAQAVYFEARGEPAEGQAAVARVILNRVGDARYPATICGVVFQNERSLNRCQFHFACDGLSDRPREAAAWELANRIAYMVRENWLPDPIGDAKYFHAKSVGKPDWTRKMVRVAAVGGHVFYADRRID
jgi:hypothetical protein